MAGIKKVAIFLAQKDFQDQEYLTPRKILRENEIAITVMAQRKGEAIGAFGEKVNITEIIADFSAADYDALFLVGGAGALTYLDNEVVYNKIRETFSQNKIIGAICIAPLILAKAGVLRDKKATVWTSDTDRHAVNILKENGAKYASEKVVVDGKIITGSGPWAAEEFGRVLAREILKK